MSLALGGLEGGRGEVSGSFTDSHPAPMPGETVGPIDRATVTPRQFGSRMVRVRPLPEVVYVSWAGVAVVAGNDNHERASYGEGSPSALARPIVTSFKA